MVYTYAKTHMEADVNKYTKVLLFNMIIVAIAVFCYSPGFWDLRLSDESIFRAGMSIIMALVLGAACVYGNYQMLGKKEYQKITREDISDIDKAETLLKMYFDGKYFGKTAKAAEEQLQRMLKSFNRAESLIDERFDKGSLSWNKYYSIVQSAQSSALDNVISMANRIQMFDESEYRRLSKYKDDMIPDEVQEQQLELYDKNMDKIKNAIAVNEKLLLKMDTLSMELSDVSQEHTQSDELLKEIEQLTEEVKYYR